VTVLALDGLSAGYGGVDVVHDLTLAVGAGRIVTVIGPNGAGKSTLLMAVMGVQPSRGGVALDGTDVAGLGVEARVRAGMSLVPETRELFATMPVADNLLLGAWRHRGLGHGERQARLDEVFAYFPRLKERHRQAAGTLSGGERQMLAMGRALMAQPSLLMLDEPSLGLAPLIVGEILRIVQSLRAAGKAILLVEQNARAALEVADEAYVLEGGRVTLSGPAASLAADERVVQTYLGIG
jgi:branched-chain amino acid transport system ATP-binding protein